MVNNSVLFKSFVVGSPLGILLFNEIRRIKNLRDEEKLSKSLFIKNFQKGNITKEEENGNSYKTNKHIFEGLNSTHNDEEVLNYFYGKAWGYTTDYEIDQSLNTGDLVFIKHDLESVNFFRKVLLKLNRYIQYGSGNGNGNGNSSKVEDYDEVGIILKKHNISYIYMQNILNGKEKLIRYSHFLQKYKPSVLSLRRFITDDEHIKKELHKNIVQSIQKDQINKYHHSIFFNLLYNFYKQKIRHIHRNVASSPSLQQKKDCLCSDNNTMCKQISSYIDMNNLMNILKFRSFNLFFYFVAYLNEHAFKNNSSAREHEHVILQGISADIQKEGLKYDIPKIQNKNGLQFYEFPLNNSLTRFEFIKSDCEELKLDDRRVYSDDSTFGSKRGSIKRNIIESTRGDNFESSHPPHETIKEIEKFLTVLLENEYTLIDFTEYLNKVLQKGHKLSKSQEEESNQKVDNYDDAGNNRTHSNYFVNKINFYSEKIYTMFKKFIMPNSLSHSHSHVYEIYRNTSLLPSIKNYHPSPCFFLCLNNFYKPINEQNMQQDKFIVPKLSNLFHVRQEEPEKLQRYFYQFNRVPKS
ncbi:hypothetical protein, conserved [Plasmodium gonderi]|uniref:Uncharacterized protein n=1 Tax=Plasmodium gonderi TaxID=77519 RepID=A0A1Y1JKN7_PLAGO|nr:hypothetical protein, conserved [Plasmodium gonderi]GAW80983.1 hypothetical protein, conserved [Plasmodium gonderi]